MYAILHFVLRHGLPHWTVLVISTADYKPLNLNLNLEFHNYHGP